jgi:glycosyltransferase involved in cell wall biosynthesis
MRVIQINSIVNQGSTGRISEEIGLKLIEHGHESIIAYGRGNNRISSSTLKLIQNRFNFVLHLLVSYFLDGHGSGSKIPTKKLIRYIKKIKPDVILIHNVHGYYLNIELLFKYLQGSEISVFWTLHDCWAVTGHCAHFDFIGCEKWKTECKNCELRNRYPKSFILDKSLENYNFKLGLYANMQNLEIIVPSKWLEKIIKQSFLKHRPIHLINNGIDLSVFNIIPNIKKENLILGVASTWDRIKGLEYFLNLREILNEDVLIVLIGLSKKQIKNLPKGILGIERTENVTELVAWYNKASVFVNTTLVDTFPTVNIEALACGTPVVTFDTGGSPEIIDLDTGIVVEKRNLEELNKAINLILSSNSTDMRSKCRSRAIHNYNKQDKYEEYLKLFEKCIN